MESWHWSVDIYISGRALSYDLQSGREAAAWADDPERRLTLIGEGPSERAWKAGVGFADDSEERTERGSKRVSESKGPLRESHSRPHWFRTKNALRKLSPFPARRRKQRPRKARAGDFCRLRNRHFPHMQHASMMPKNTRKCPTTPEDAACRIFDRRSAAYFCLSRPFLHRYLSLAACR